MKPESYEDYLRKNKDQIPEGESIKEIVRRKNRRQWFAKSNKAHNSLGGGYISY